MDKDLLYRKEILDYYKNPMFKEDPSSYDLKAHLKKKTFNKFLILDHFVQYPLMELNLLANTS